jgi:hypothetical protein
MTPTEFEEEYLDVLQNLEFGIVQVARQNPEMVDWQVQSAVEALMAFYRARAAGNPDPELASDLAPLAQETHDLVYSIAEWLVGQGEVRNKEGERVDIPFEPLTGQEIYDCLKRIRKSIRRWTKRAGRRGYLNYIDQFLPQTPDVEDLQR